MKQGRVVRKKALHFAVKHFFRLFPIYFLYLACLQALQYALPPGSIKAMGTALLQILTFPVITISMQRIVFDIWRGEKAISWDVFSCYRIPAKLKSAIVQAILFSAINFIMSFPVDFANDLLDKSLVFLALGLLLMKYGMFFLCFWIRERLFLSTYLLAIDYSHSTGKLIKTSFRDMRGNVCKHICFWFSICWWWMILLGGGVGMCFALSGGEMTQALERAVRYCLAVLSAVLYPYFLFCNVGFASELLPSQRQLRKLNKG